VAKTGTKKTGTKWCKSSSVDTVIISLFDASPPGPMIACGMPK
jgi:hypothetical protein